MVAGFLLVAALLTRWVKVSLHVAFAAGGNFRVSEIWSSLEQFQAFGERLMPILTESGVELEGPPEIIEIHNIIRR